MKKIILFIALGAMFFGGNAQAAEADMAAETSVAAEAGKKAEAPKEKKQTMFNGSTNLQVFYDFGADRQCVTTTVEGFYMDPWGSTFFFIDYDYNPKAFNMPEGQYSPNGSYWEIARALNFWKNSAVKDLSAHVEYNGGVYSKYGINHAFLVGAEYFLHSKDFRNTFTFELLYKNILYTAGDYGRGYEEHHQTVVPLQFTFVWGMKDLFKVRGLSFSGFLDVWGEEHMVYDVDMSTGNTDWTSGQLSHVVFLSEPQLWYNVGQHFGCDNLNVGTEIELSADFGTAKGFKCRPCLGVKWIF